MTISEPLPDFQAESARVPGHDGRQPDSLIAFAHRFLATFDDASYSEIARRLKTNHATIIPWATGKRMPTGDLLLRIHKVTGVNLHWLITGNGPMRDFERATFTPEEETRINNLAVETNRTFDETVRHLAITALFFKDQV